MSHYAIMKCAVVKQQLLVVTLVCVLAVTGLVNSQGLSIATPPTHKDIRSDNIQGVDFSIEVTGGSGTLTFTWRLNGAQVLRTSIKAAQPSLVKDILTINQTTLIARSSSLEGNYTCEVRDNSFPPQIVTSPVAKLEILHPPVFTVRPQDTVANLEDIATFRCEATGKPAPTFSWEANGVAIPGEVGTSLTVNISRPSLNLTLYTCKITNQVSFTSASARLTVISRHPYFKEMLPSTALINYNKSFTMKCNASGIPAINLQWFSTDIPGTWSIIAGHTQPTLSVVVLRNISYRCTANNQIGQAISIVNVQVNIVSPTVTYSSFTFSQRTFVGYPIQIGCISEGVPSPRIHWEFKQSGYNTVRKLPASENKYYYKTNAESGDQGLYYCIATNVGGESRGAGIYLIVDNLTPPPIFTFTSWIPVVTSPGHTGSLPTTTPVTMATTASSTSGSATAVTTGDASATMATGSQSTTAGSMTDNSTSGIATGDEVGNATTTPFDPSATTLSNVPTQTVSGSASDGSVQNTADSTDSSGSDDDQVVTIVVPVVVVIVVISILVILTLLYLNHKRSQLGQDDQKPLAESRQNTQKIVDNGGPEMEMDVMASAHPELSAGYEGSLQRQASSPEQQSGLTMSDLTSLLTRVERAMGDGERSNELVVQYESIPLNMVSIDQFVSVLGTEHKNRYMNVLPNADTAVRLDEDPPGDLVSTYINANYMLDFLGNKKAFIATQGPTADTINDFWRMVWKEESSVIVMATQLVERGRAKCMRYWPENGTSQVYDKLGVNVDDVTDTADYLLTDMTLYKTDEEGTAESGTSRKIHHFWFKGWPDFGIPNYTDPVLNFLDTIAEVNSNNAPVIIHCSAGIGRTGTLVAIKMGMQQFEQQMRINPVKYLDTLRECRGGCIQTFDQYLFVHRALLTFMTRQHASSGQPSDTTAEEDEAVDGRNAQEIDGHESETKLL